MRLHTTLGMGVAALAAMMVAPLTAQAKVEFGKKGEKVNLVVGYQPYYTESWSGVVNNAKSLDRKSVV